MAQQMMQTQVMPPPTPYPSPGPGSAMSPAQPPTSQFGNNPLTVPPPTPPQGADAVMPGGGAGGRFNNWGPNEKNFYGGQQIAGATPSQADYGSVQTYADAAHQNARRYLDPQQAAQNRRLQQEMINKGVDPNSAAGQEMAATLGRQQADANNAAAFGALQFGQGIQDQMSRQELANQQLAGQMQQALWGQQGQAAGRDLQWGLGQMQNRLGMAGLDVQRQLGNQQYQLGLGQQDLARYQADLGHQLGMGQLDLGRNQAEHGQMMDLLGYDMGVRQYNDQQQMIQDAMFNQWYGNVPVPGMGAVDPYGPISGYWGAGTITNRGKGGQAGFSFGM